MDFPSERTEYPEEQPHRGCLAIRPGDADHIEAIARMIVDGGRGRAQGSAYRVDHDFRYTQAESMFAEDRHCPPVDGIAGMKMTVSQRAGNACEQCSWPNPTGIVLDIVDEHDFCGAFGHQQPKCIDHVTEWSGHVGFCSGTEMIGVVAGSARTRPAGIPGSLTGAIRSCRSAYAAISLNTGADTAPPE